MAREELNKALERYNEDLAKAALRHKRDARNAAIMMALAAFGALGAILALFK